MSMDLDSVTVSLLSLGFLVPSPEQVWVWSRLWGTRCKDIITLARIAAGLTSILVLLRRQCPLPIDPWISRAKGTLKRCNGIPHFAEEKTEALEGLPKGAQVAK